MRFGLKNEYKPFGKWMDEWESRRTEGYDWCILHRVFGSLLIITRIKHILYSELLS